MKIALCFIISYEHILNKEDIWREWIEHNKDIINVYFYYGDLKKIKSRWIFDHTIPPNHIYPTTYYHVIPAYISVLSFAYSHDKDNQWFCLLTDSCCPLISPQRFRRLFFENYEKSIIKWRQAWWNVDLHKRANLRLLEKELRLGNDPWFVLKREHIYTITSYFKKKPDICKLLCSGGLANESIFAIALKCCYQLNADNVVCESTHATDWTRMMSSTSPYLFKDVNDTDIRFIEKTLAENPYVMFIRKIHADFPDEILKKYIYSYNVEDNEERIVYYILVFRFLMKKYFIFFVFGIFFGLYLFMLSS
jgi:hypothetical protein